MQAQFPLELSVRSEQRFDNFIARGNELALFLLRSLSAANTAFDADAPASESRLPSHKQLFVWGASGAGKSHALNAVANDAFRQKKRVFVLSYAIVTEANFGVEILEGLASQDILCFDDLDRLLGLPEWAPAIEGLIEQAHQQGCRLVFSASDRPQALEPCSPTLIERFQWGPVIEMLTPDTAVLELMLIQRAKDMGLIITPDVCQYLLKRLPPEPSVLISCIQVLGQESLASQRHLNRRFVSQRLSTQARISEFLASLP